MTTRRTKFPGVPFPKHAPKYILPGLGLRELKAHKEDLKKLLALEKSRRTSNGEGEEGGLSAADMLTEVLEVVSVLAHAAALRNHAGVKREEIEDLIDSNNLNDVILAIMGQSGFTLTTELPAENTEGTPLGES